MLKTVSAIACVALVSMMGKKPIDNEHFLIYGSVLEVDPIENAQMEAIGTRVTVYEDGDIFVAFKTNEEGEFQFNLPVGGQYTLAFGGDDYVNKIVTIDAKTLGVEKRGESVEIDMGLFRNHAGADYTYLAAPVAKFRYHRDEGFSANQVYANKMAMRTMQCLDDIRAANK